MSDASPQIDLAPFDAVFDAPSSEGRTRLPGGWLPWAIALAVHGLFILSANGSEPSLETWGARVAAEIHNDLAAVAATEVIPVEPAAEPEASEPEPAPAAEEPPAPRPRARTTTTTPSPESPATPAAAQAAQAAQAAEVVTAPEPSGPVDFTDNTFVSGTAMAYAGGTTASEGTSAEAVTAPVVSTSPDAEGNTSDESAASSQARPVQLAAGAWRCAWPRTAPDDMYEQSVTLRVVVGADGAVESARVVRDPGNGFGAAAVACARRTRFVSALDADGEPIRATSPPIRVRFTR